MKWIPCNPVNQYYISELGTCKDKPYLVTYRTLKGRLYVTKVNIKNGRIQGKIGGEVIAYMPLPKPYTADTPQTEYEEPPMDEYYHDHDEFYDGGSEE